MRLAWVLLAVLVLPLSLPAASAAAPESVCYGRPVGWEGYVRYCVHPHDPTCAVEYTFYNLGEEWRTCYPGDLLPAAHAEAAGRCIRRDVTWESYETWCVEPTSSSCRVSRSYHALGDDHYECVVR